jgi:hypothetical protein
MLESTPQAASADSVLPSAISAENHELMYRVKPKSSLCHKLKMNARLIGLMFCILTVSVYFMMFTDGNTRQSNFMPADRSENYKVKVIPADMDDEALNALPKETFSYLAMIDAGSSGCRAHIYRYGKLGSLTGKLYILPHHVSKKVKPGLSSFANNPQDAGPSLKDLITFMKQEVPESDWSVTPIWLKATAGLRMLDTRTSDAVLKSVKDFLSNKEVSPFLFLPSWARIISGNEEGGFGWIAYNYLRKIIGPKKVPGQAPYAVVEMGGASSQVSQLAPSKAEAERIPKEYRFSFNIEGDAYDLYTHSYLGFGAEQGREKLNKLLTSGLAASNSKTDTIKDPCLNAGFTRPGTVARREPYEGPQGIYFNVSGAADNSGVCKAALQNVFAADGSPAGTTCDKSHSGPFSFGCTYQPSFVADSTNFLLFENFFYMSSAIGVKPAAITAAAVANADTNTPATTAPPAAFPLVTTPSNILEATNKVCSVKWDALGTDYPFDAQPKDVNTKMCFIGSYSYSFLTNGLKIPDDKHVTIQKDVGKSEIEWALGAAYKEAADFLKRTNLRPT